MNDDGAKPKRDVTWPQVAQMALAVLLVGMLLAAAIILIKL